MLSKPDGFIGFPVFTVVFSLATHGLKPKAVRVLNAMIVHCKVTTLSLFAGPKVL